MATCYRHPDRETGVSCSRCGRPICPDCMTPTSVGMRCPECAGERTEVKQVNYGATGSGQATATLVLIGINVAVFLFEVLGGSGGVGSTGGRVFADGALCGNAIGDGGLCLGGGVALATDGGEWWRVLTSGFLHQGIFHLGLNMFALYILGQVLEPAIGTARFVAVYLVSLLAGSVGALLLSDPLYVWPPTVRDWRCMLCSGLPHPAGCSRCCGGSAARSASVTSGWPRWLAG